jgi:hypothetical protein
MDEFANAKCHNYDTDDDDDDDDQWHYSPDGCTPGNENTETNMNLLRMNTSTSRIKRPEVSPF